MWQRARDAKLYLAFASSQGEEHRGPREKGVMRKFIEASSSAVLSPAEIHRSMAYLRRACELLRRGGYEAATAYDTRGGGGRTAKEQRLRRRRRGFQGRPKKAPLIRELLYTWFTSLRRSVTTRIPRRVVENKARALVEDYIGGHARRGLQADVPAISPQWIREWMREYRVSLRQPNRKWKVPRDVLVQRLETFWSNVFRVRQLCLLAHGHEPIFENFDQSPFHMNEAGSKEAGTLAVRGAPIVPLKEGHAATRERWSAQTMTTSCPARAAAIPPFELMFKARGDRLAKGLRASIPAWAPWLTIVTGPRGSYREEHILNYMETVLEPWAPGRKWRILLCDAYGPQTTDAVRRAAWQRGYVVLVHGGGQTSVTQTNDTDLHARLKQLYLELEGDEMIRQQRLQPKACPVPRKHDVIQWMAIIWNQASLHTPAVAGYKKTGITNALDGTEDHLICREAGEAWRTLQMSRRRQEVLEDVRQEWKAGRLEWCFEDVYKVVVPYPDAHPRYAQEMDDDGTEEGGEEEDWPEDADMVDGDGEAAVEATDTPHERETSAVAETTAAVLPLTAEQADVAAEHARRLRILRTILADVEGVDGGALRVTILNAIHAEERRARGRKQTDPQVAAALSQEEDAEERRGLLLQKSMQDALATEKKHRGTLAELAAEQRRVAAAKKDLAAAQTIVACQRALKSFDTADLGQGHIRGGGANHVATRMEVLDRVMRKGEALPPEQMNDWEWFKRKWDATRIACLRVKAAWGSMFRDIVRSLLEEIAKGRKDAVAAWMRRERREYLAVPALRL